MTLISARLIAKAGRGNMKLDVVDSGAKNDCERARWGEGGFFGLVLRASCVPDTPTYDVVGSISVDRCGEISLVRCVVRGRLPFGVKCEIASLVFCT